MKKLFCLSLCAVYFFSTTVCMAFEAECMNTNGKFTDCKAEVNDGTLSVHYKNKKWQSLDRTIKGDEITALSGGEYARRRVGESIGSAVLLGPLFLFVLFSKKKRDNIGVEYMTEAGMKDAVLIQVKKKYGFALAQQLKTISGKEIQMESTGEKTKQESKKNESSPAEEKVPSQEEQGS